MDLRHLITPDTTLESKTRESESVPKSSFYKPERFERLEEAQTKVEVNGVTLNLDTLQKNTKDTHIVSGTLAVSEDNVRFQLGSTQPKVQQPSVVQCDYMTYGVRYPDLMDQFKDDLLKYRDHFFSYGTKNGMLCSDDNLVWNPLAYAKRYGILGDNFKAWSHYVMYGRKAGYSPLGNNANLGDPPIVVNNGRQVVASLGPIHLDLTRTLQTLQNRRPPAQNAFLTLESVLGSWSFDLLSLGALSSTGRGDKAKVRIALEGVDVDLDVTCHTMSFLPENDRRVYVALTVNGEVLRADVASLCPPRSPTTHETGFHLRQLCDGPSSTGVLRGRANNKDFQVNISDVCNTIKNADTVEIHNPKANTLLYQGPIPESVQREGYYDHSHRSWQSGRGCAYPLCCILVVGVVVFILCRLWNQHPDSANGR